MSAASRDSDIPCWIGIPFGMVTIKRVSPSGTRACANGEMYCVSVPLFHEGIAPHGFAEFVLGDTRLGFCSRKRERRSLGVRETGESAREQRALTRITRKLAETVPYRRLG